MSIDGSFKDEDNFIDDNENTIDETKNPY